MARAVVVVIKLVVGLVAWMVMTEDSGGAGIVEVGNETNVW